MGDLPSDEVPLGIAIPVEDVSPHLSWARAGGRNFDGVPVRKAGAPLFVGRFYSSVLCLHFEGKVGLRVGVVEPELYRLVGCRSGPWHGIERFSARAQRDDHIGDAFEQSEPLQRLENMV